MSSVYTVNHGDQHIELHFDGSAATMWIYSGLDRLDISTPRGIADMLAAMEDVVVMTNAVRD